MNFLQTFLKIGGSTFFAILISAIVIKIISVNYGPNGLAEFGLVRDNLRLILFAAAFSSSNAIINALNSENILNKISYLNNVFKIFLIILPLVAIISFFYLSSNLRVFDYGTYDILILISIGIIAGLSQIFIAILNGYKHVNDITRNQIISFSLSLLVIFFYYGSNLYIYYFFALYLSWFALSFLSLRAKGISISFYEAASENLDRNNVHQISAFAGGNLITTIAGIVTLIQIKTHTLLNFSESDLGQLEAGITISTVYMAIFTSAVGVYLLPKYSKSRDPQELSKILYFLLLLLLFIVVTVGFLSYEVTTLLFSNEFLQASRILAIMITGDLLKIFTIVITFIFLADRKIIHFVFSCLAFNISFYASYYFLSQTLGIESISYAYIIANFVMFIYCAYYSIKLKYLKNSLPILSFLVVFILLIALSNNL